MLPLYVYIRALTVGHLHFSSVINVRLEPARMGHCIIPNVYITETLEMNRGIPMLKFFLGVKLVISITCIYPSR